MKYVFFTFLILFLCTTASFAQLGFGIKAGGMLSNTVVVEPDSSSGSEDAKLSYLIGGFMTVPISSKFSIQPELLYANKGNKRFNQHYINLPVMLQYKLTDKLKLEAGPEIGYLLASYSESSTRRFETKDLDFGINIGANYALLDRLNVGLRYNMGILDTHDPSQARFGFGSSIDQRDFNIQNRTLQLSVGWKLGK